MVTKKVIVHGLVQGVGFRYSMCAQAESLGIKGTVRNKEDGTVDIVLQGEKEKVQQAFEWIKKGPAGSRVDKVDVSDGAGQFNDFSISYSASE